ncbi:hypothetical protein [Roseateles cavernae]
MFDDELNFVTPPVRRHTAEGVDIELAQSAPMLNQEISPTQHDGLE